MPRAWLVAKAVLIGMYCGLAVVLGGPAYGGYQTAPGATPDHVVQNVAPGVRFADGRDYRESKQPPGRTCTYCGLRVPRAAGHETSPIPASAWVVMAAMFILLGIKYPSNAVTLWFLGLAGFLVGGASQFFDLTWQLQLVVFGLSGICLVVTWSRLDQSAAPRTSGQTLNSRHPATLLGRVFQLQKPIVNGTGMLTIDETTWRIAGPDCAAGDRVLVVHVEGTLLVVSAIAR